EVRRYLDQAIKWLVEDCGFEFLKLDFLYAIYFDKSLPVADADRLLREFLARIRRTYPHVHTLACGCPLVPAIGVVDSMRVGPDSIISPFLKFARCTNVLNFFLHRQFMRTIRKRLWTKAFWNIDPDAFVCRDGLGLSQ